MFDFEHINIDNRLRYPVRGRVIGFTNSTDIEFIDCDLTRSIVLFSTWPYVPGTGVTFFLELHGYLTFKPGTEVRIEELAPYKSPHYSADSFRLTKPADPFRSLVTGGGFFNAPNGFGPGLAEFQLFYSTEFDGDQQVVLRNIPGIENGQAANDLFARSFPTGSRYKPGIYEPNFSFAFFASTY